VCGRFRQTQDWSEIERRFGAKLSERVLEQYQVRYNVAPTDPVIAIRRRDDDREAGYLRWGLVPHWSKGPTSRAPMINAKAETLAEKPAFRSLLATKRCLIPADGFYEWRTGTGGGREPLDLSLRTGGLFAFAGLWAAWKEKDGEWLRSCAIITTRPNELVAEVHDRMPVILPPDAEDDWLDPDVSVEHALSLLEPYPAAQMRSVAVSPLVNSVRNDGPELLAPA
jgi:putative SOS response-associated peptidase YedK